MAKETDFIPVYPRVIKTDGTIINTANSYNSDGTLNTNMSMVDGLACVPNDSTDFVKLPTDAIYVGTAGDVKVTLQSGAVVTFKALAPGLYRISPRRIWATGTTALDIVVLYDM